jgi:hypothetical protein
VTNSSLAWGSFALRGEPATEPGVAGGVAVLPGRGATWINNEIPHLLLIEITLWVSIAFHSILGSTTRRRASATPSTTLSGQLAVHAPALSGTSGILFIFYHIATLRWQWTFLVPGGAEWSHHFSASTLAAALQGSTDG